MSARDGHDRKHAVTTASIWALGVALQFATPLLRDRLPLSDDLFVASFVYPWWSFAQVILLAVVLALLTRPLSRQSLERRRLVAVAISVLCALPQPDLIAQMLGTDVPLAHNPMRVSLLWSTPLAFYVAPAAVVVHAWTARRHRLTLVRALGIGLVSIGIAGFPYLLWLTRLWRLHIDALPTAALPSLLHLLATTG